MKPLKRVNACGLINILRCRKAILTIFTALIKPSGVREEHAHIQPDIQNHADISKFDSPRVFPAVPQPSGKTTGNEIGNEQSFLTASNGSANL